MESCKGIGNWLECLNCPQLCKKECPIENANAMEEIGKQIRNSSLCREMGDTYHDRKRIRGTGNS
jgi:hypothetical protein